MRFPSEYVPSGGQQDGTIHETVHRVADIRVRAGQEVLVLGGGGIVRLDRLLEVDGVAYAAPR